MMFVFMTMCGYFATRILKSGLTERGKLQSLFAYSVALLACGGVLSVWVPVIKHTFTVSFTALAMGISAALLGLLYYLTDVLRFRRGLGICILFGQFALTAYMCEEYFKPVFVRFSEMLLIPGVERIAGRYMPLVMAVACVVELTVVLVIRRRKKKSQG
jgi:predicted acyltransferase